MKVLKSIFAAAVLAFGAAPAANAVSFDLTGSGNFSSYDLTSGGLTLTVSPASFIDLTNTIIGPDGNDVVTRRSGGTGIDRGFLDGGQIDGRLGNDLLVLTFDQKVVFNSVTFGAVDGNDDFDLAIDGIFVLEDINIAASNPFLFAAGTMGTVLGIGADGLNDDFRVKAIDVTAIPLPAGFLLLLSGMGAIAFVGRRKA
ncbi:MAG: VPLPA-CTERM sorting domain-containing protein [Pseudomonadota bacterium]